MTVTNTVTEEQTNGVLPQLNMADLKTIKWVGDTHYFQQAYQSSVSKYNHYKTWPIVRWIFAAIELVVISVAMFIQQLPWPEKVVTAVYKIDNMMESGLTFTYNKLDWWWDIFMVRSIRLRDSLENLIDGILSFGFYCILLLGNVWECYVSFFKLTLIPYIWLYRIITQASKLSPPSNVNHVTTEDINKEPNLTLNESKRPSLSNEDISETTDYESDVSAISESWSLGHSNKSGHSYNRLETKVTAEGKLRAIMQKRVQSQLGVMRKHSLRFSKGLASYIKEYWEPKMKPAVKAVSEWIHRFAKKFGLINVLEYARKKISCYPFIENQLTIIFYLVIWPMNVYSSLTTRRKSRRSRSVRSESLRRRLAAEGAKQSVPLLPTELNRSAEIIKEEQISSIPNKYCDETDSNCNRDSALTSSIDDIATSDSNDISVKKIMEKTRNSCIHESNSVPDINLRIDEECEFAFRTAAVNARNIETGPKTPQLPRIKVSGTKDDNTEAAFLLSPKFKRRNRNRHLKFEHRKFLSDECMPASPEVVSDAGTTFEGSSSLLKRKKTDKNRKISFTL